MTSAVGAVCLLVCSLPSLQLHTVGILLPVGRWSYIFKNWVSRGRAWPGTQHALLAASVLTPTSSSTRTSAPT